MENKLRKLVRAFYKGIVEDFETDNYAHKTRYWYYLEASLTSIFLLDRKAQWKETEFTSMPTSISVDFWVNEHDCNYLVSQRGKPDIVLMVCPRLDFFTFFYTPFGGSMETSKIYIYHSDLPTDKFVIRRMEETIVPSR